MDELMSLQEIDALVLDPSAHIQLSRRFDKQKLRHLCSTARAAHKLKQRVEELEQSIGVCPDCKEAYSLTEQQATL